MTLLDFNNWLLELNRFSGLAVILYFVFFPKRLMTIYGLLFLTIAFSFLADNIIWFFIRFVYPNSFIIGNSWLLLNFGIVSWLFGKLLPERRLVIIVSGVLFFVGATVSFGWFFSFLEFNTFIGVYSCINFTILSVFLYLRILNDKKTQLKTMPEFWIANAFFFYSSLTLFRSLFTQFAVFDLEISKELHSAISIINLTANIAKNFILFYALILIDKGFLHAKKEIANG
ncbi:MAG: hypothetical protein Tsb0034_29470 [Ekhidna sp.]